MSLNINDSTVDPAKNNYDDSTVPLKNNVAIYTVKVNSALNNLPCYFAANEGITSCHNCRAKYVCDKSPEVKLQ